MRTNEIKRWPVVASVAIVAAALTISLTPVYAQKHSGGSSHSGTEHSDSDHGSKGGQRGGQGMGRGGGGSQSLRDVFHEMESGSTTEHSSATSEDHGSSSKGGKKGSASTAKKGSTASGKKSGKSTIKATEEEESDRPAWAGTSGRDSKPGRGNVASGTKKGDVYGDMYVLLRDANGVPILKQLADGTWVVQPVDKDGNVLPLDVEGNLINPDLAIAVELGRLNVGRSPLTVLSTRYEEALAAINAANSVTLDASGRLLLTTDGVTKTIDAPLENLALYVELLNTGTITGVTDTSKFASNIQYLVDGTKTSTDFVSAASFLAAASDKTSTLTIDKVVDMNTILGITGSLTDTTGATYVDYSTYSYDRQSIYADVTVNVLVKQPDGSYVPTVVNVYDTLFNSTAYTGTSVSGFTQAADDALKVISYVHDNAIPEGE